MLISHNLCRPKTVDPKVSFACLVKGSRVAFLCVSLPPLRHVPQLIFANSLLSCNTICTSSVCIFIWLLCHVMSFLDNYKKARKS